MSDPTPIRPNRDDRPVRPVPTWTPGSVASLMLWGVLLTPFAIFLARWAGGWL